MILPWGGRGRGLTNDYRHHLRKSILAIIYENRFSPSFTKIDARHDLRKSFLAIETIRAMEMIWTIDETSIIE
jgi:hypothetical protein